MTRSNTSPARRKPRGVCSLVRSGLVGGAAVVSAGVVMAVGGCQVNRPKPVSMGVTTRPAAAGLVAPSPWPSVGATVTPPAGWRADPLKANDKHAHQVWVSPSGRTAFGVIHFTMPLPVSASFVLPFYMSAWRRDQGEARLLTETVDPGLPGVRFVAEGGRYKTWSNLIVSGTEGWSIYAAVLRAGPVEEGELGLAESAREHTQVGLPGAGG